MTSIPYLPPTPQEIAKEFNIPMEVPVHMGPDERFPIRMEYHPLIRRTAYTYWSTGGEVCNRCNKPIERGSWAVRKPESLFRWHDRCW